MITWLVQQTRSIENPSTSLADPDEWLYEGLGAGRSTSGVRMGREKALTIATVWRAVSLIARDVAKLPIILYQRAGAGKERAIEHPAYRLLRKKPCEWLTAFQWKQVMTVHVLLHGNGYSVILRRGDGSPEEILPLSPIATYPVRANGRLWYITTVDGRPIKLLPEDVLHFKGLGFDGLIGYSWIQKARDSLGLTVASEEYGSRFFSNDARPSVVLETPNRLGEKARSNLRESWNAIHQGVSRAHRVAILEEGLKLRPFSANAKESQLLEQRKFQVREVANWFDLPPHKLGDDAKSSYNSLEQENQAYLDSALDPHLVGIEEECEDKLLTEEQKEQDTHVVSFLRSALVRADLAERYAAYSIGIDKRIVNPNEVRAMEDMNPYDGGDEFLVPLNMGQGGNPAPAPLNPPEDPPPDPEPAGRQVPASALRAIVADAARRMIRRLATHAGRVAGRPAEFMSWLDTFGAQHRPVIIEALAPGVLACGANNSEVLADRLLAGVRAAFLDRSGRCTAGELAAGVDLEMRACEIELAGQLAEELLP